MKRRAVVPIFAALAGIFALGLAAAALSSSLPPGASYKPPEVSGGSGLSLYALLVLLIMSVLQFLFGTEPSLPAIGASGSPIQLVVSAVQALYQLLPLILTVSVVAIAVASALSYTDQGRRALASLSASPQDTSTLAPKASAVEKTPTRPGVEPSNEVYRAWNSMVRHIDVDRFESRTPTECATAAIEGGFSKAAVEILTDEFEAVRYGGRSVTKEREQRARHALSQLELDSDPVSDSERDGSEASTPDE